MQKAKLNQKFKRKWVNALRSGKYNQGRGMLFDHDKNAYCCLGVACAAAHIPQSKILKIGFIDALLVRRNKDNLNSSDKAALNTLIAVENLQDKLAHFNDTSRLSFKWIASWIEKNL